MPPRAFASPKKRRPMKCKGSDASTKNIAKKSQAQETSVEASSMPLVSLGLVHANMAGTDAPWHPVRSKAGTGGRAAQLEKIGLNITWSQHPHQPSGSRTDSQLQRPKNSFKVRIQAAPPPYTSVPDTSKPCSIVEPLQLPGFSLRQQGARFGFADNSLIIPPKPSLNHPYDAVGRNIPKKFAKNTGTGHTAAHLVAPPTTGFLEWTLDPVLHNENDGDNPDNGDEQNAGPEGEMREQEIGWGEVGRRHSDHPGFSREEPPLHTRLPPSCCLTPDFDFTFSRDEDDMATQASLGGVANSARQPGMESRDPSDVQWYNASQGLLDSMQGRQQLQDAELMVFLSAVTSKPQDALKRHHNKNGQPRLPDPNTLELLHQVTESDKPTQNSRIKRSKEPNDGPKPTQLTWYGPHWTSFLEDAKGECRTEHALQNPFPTLIKDLPASVTEVLVAVLVAWDQEGKQFKAGIWPQQKPNMARLLYDDLATWRSDLKKSVMSIAPVQYSLIPLPLVPTQLCAEWIEKAAAALLANSLFLRHGVDNMRQPDIFRNQLPLSCLALVGTAVLFLYYSIVSSTVSEKNGNGKYYPKFTAKEYGPIYRKMLQLLKDILKDRYHGPILLVQLREWAQVGWAEISKINGAIESGHNHLQIILD
ncbi:uncharacterized protein F5147DRAFT_650814 [Suillus discolor]|uniref:DUF6532 domain-containing protein n=1 Tax=Suillus discolor TaxID=1912936 RepID=A0A9P7FB52_9AGAM|nr:uncharacterized protein F5147DRAFT_650814 [Suillus discolor]KAG2112661.1 hypothetical protein F5147DRAFT_650814 [Suillus discolor]